MRFLHLSDIHINAGFSAKTESVRTRLKEGLRHSFSRAIDYVLEENLEGLIVAGDFFDHDKVSFKDEVYLTDTLLKLLNHQRKIFWVTGNHDPMNTIRFHHEVVKHPNFFIFEEDRYNKVELMSLNNEPYCVVGIGHKSKNEKRNLIKEFPVKNSTIPWIGIAHASVPSAQTTADKESYMAVALAQIEALGYDYFALGHIHIRQQLTSNIAYSGNIQGLNIKETGNRGGFEVSVTDHGTILTPVDFNEILWDQLTVNVDETIETIDSLHSLLTNQIMNLVNQYPKPASSMIFRVHLEGKTVLKKQIQETENLRFLEASIQAKTGILDVEIKSERLSGLYKLEKLCDENTVLSLILKQINNNAYDDILLEKLCELPIFDRQMVKAEKIQYLNQMSSILQDEVIQRMVVDKNEG